MKTSVKHFGLAVGL